MRPPRRLVHHFPHLGYTGPETWRQLLNAAIPPTRIGIVLTGSGKRWSPMLYLYGCNEEGIGFHKGWRHPSARAQRVVETGRAAPRSQNRTSARAKRGGGGSTRVSAGRFVLVARRRRWLGDAGRLPRWCVSVIWRCCCCWWCAWRTAGKSRRYLALIRGRITVVPDVFIKTRAASCLGHLLTTGALRLPSVNAAAGETAANSGIAWDVALGRKLDDDCCA